MSNKIALHTSFFEFDRTIEIIIASFSRPWKPSTVEISISFSLSSLLLNIFSKRTCTVPVGSCPRKSHIKWKEKCIDVASRFPFVKELFYLLTFIEQSAHRNGRIVESQKLVYLSCIRGDYSNIRSQDTTLNKSLCMGYSNFSFSLIHCAIFFIFLFFHVTSEA